ncbi:MAG TPA: glucose-1-phosphate cytidylyltransferase [Pirellulales bacterium]|nr:glucose-1-phosphate cytidylyltransferase [Pirellulales bacterium]
MQVVILCGGQGTRIRDVADDLPKPMIPIGGRPILWHIMKGYAQHGFTDFVLCLGYKSWVIKRYFLEYHLAGVDFSLRLGSPAQVRVHDAVDEADWHVTLAETGLDAMTGCRVKRIEPYITGERFMLTYGDGVADIDLARLLAFHRSHGKLGTVTAIQPPSRFGEIELHGPRVVEFMEKPLASRGRINGGFFVFEREFLGRLADDPASVLEREPLTRLAGDGQLMAYLHDGFWHPMDSSRDYNQLNQLWSEGQAPWKVWEKPRLRKAA